MPKRRLAHKSDDIVVSDAEDHESVAITSKKAKLSESEAASTILNGTQKTDDNGDTYWELNAKGTRRVTISEFKGRNMVNLREYYEKDGKMLPGKKGISLVMDQFSAFLEALPQIDTALRGKGEHPPRPAYQVVGDTLHLENPEESLREKGQSKTREGETRRPKTLKANYEDTSDEESMLN